MATIKARPYGNANAPGKAISFELINELPKVGELYNEETVLEVAPQYMDPENRWSDDRMDRYNFYRIETEYEDGRDAYYVAIESKDYVEWLGSEND
jgi:hypothetical protein